MRILNMISAGLAALILSSLAQATAAQTVARAPAAATAGTGPAAAAAAPAGDAAEHAAAAAPESLVPLEANGLMARLLRSLDRWMDSLGAQMGEVRRAIADVPGLFAQSGVLATPAGRQLLTRLGIVLAAVFLVGLLLEWALRLALRRPRSALADHANSSALLHAARLPARTTVEPAAAARFASTMPDAVQARLHAEPGVALMQSQRQGVAELDAVHVGTDNAAGPPRESEDSADSDRRAPDGTTARDSYRRTAPGQHWIALRHLPYAAGVLLLDILPIALFFLAATLALRATGNGDWRVVTAAGGFIQAYVAMRLTMAVVRLLISPAGQGLRLLHIAPDTAHILVAWVRCMVVLALFGMAVADAAQALGTGVPLRLAFLKTVSLLVHLSAVVLIMKLRHPVEQALRAAPDRTDPLASAREWLARAWAGTAIVLVMGVWVVWALGVENGFPKLIHFIVVSLAILVLGRLLAILLLGALDRLFTPEPGGAAAGDAAPRADAAPASRLSERYYPWLRGLVWAVIAAGTLIALLQAWGLNALAWFAPGTLGRSLTSAILTVLVAVIVAVAVWEATQLAIDRRLALWLRQGDAVRVARLRTLLPMGRTVLFIVVALVVGLTALNQIGINTTPLLAGASIIGVAVGFGSQKLVQDFITGIFLLMENAMRVGDWVTVAGVSGSVEYLSIRTVRLRGGDGALYIVPFSSVTTVGNSNRGIGNAALRISVGYGTDIEMVIQELKRIGAALRADPAYRDQILADIEVWGVDSVDGSMVTLAGQMRCSDKGRWGVQREINRRILERFRELGIEIANPRTSVLLAPEPPARSLP